MNPVLLHDPDAINRFSREASNASRINHPNVAAIYDFGETSDEIVYLAMEFVEGESLAAMLDRKRGLREQRAMEIGCQVADALSAAHELGIVHRDLKPDNVMVCQAKGKALVKVVDFGIAKATQGGSQTVTRTGYVVGTPAYMSPEQILGDPLDGRSDLYSLGCILYEMLTGERAFVGPSGEVSLRRRLTEPPPRPRKIKRALSRSLDAIVIRAMARSPEDRFQSAAELRDALIEALKERDSRPMLRRWLTRGASDEAADTMDHDVVPAPPAFSPLPRLASDFLPDGPPVEWNQGAGSVHYSSGSTKVIRHRSARTEGWHPGWMLGGAAGLALVGISLWLLPSTGLLPGASSSASSSLPETTESAADTSQPSEEALGDSLPASPGPVLADTLGQRTDTVPVLPGVIRFEKSLPPGAQITVDSIETPLTPEGHLSLQPGSHKLQVRAPGFRPATRTVVVSAGDTASLPLGLVRIDTTAQLRFPRGGVGPGQIIVNGKLPAGTQLSVDGWLLPPGVRLAPVDSGSHWVAISAPGFEPDSSSVHLGPGGRAIWSVPKLTPVPVQQTDTSRSVDPATESILPPPAMDSSPPGLEGGK
jgi:serine/threonine protein kinase